MRKLYVERYDKGSILTVEGVFNWDFAENGIDGVLISEETGEAYRVIGVERDEDDMVTAIMVDVEIPFAALFEPE